MEGDRVERTSCQAPWVGARAAARQRDGEIVAARLFDHRAMLRYEMIGDRLLDALLAAPEWTALHDAVLGFPPELVTGWT